jgi:predicted acetyltransferase
MLKLIKPDISYKEQWEEIMTEWDDSRRRPRIFFQPDFDTFLAKLWNIESLDNVEEQIAKSSLFFLQESENQKILGLFSIRHHINFPKDATSSGHIAYGIRPTER